MATVAALALAAPAAAEEQAQTGDPAKQQIELAEQTLESAAGGEQAEGTDEAQMPATTAEGEPAEEPATTAESEPAEEPAAGAGQAPMTAEDAPVEEAEPELAEDQDAAPPADMSFIEIQEEAQFLADEEVIGKEVVNMMDEEVGTIADLVMDQDQKLVGVVLSVGGFLGIGEKWVAVPVEQIDFPTAEEPARLLAAVTEEQLKNAPDFTTRETVEAQEAAEQAQLQQQQQMQQVPAPATAPQQ
jgi:hypothetical protein